MTEIQRYNDWSMRLRAERAWLAVEQPMVFYSQLRRYRQSQRIRRQRYAAGSFVALLPLVYALLRIFV